jgi:hypothetical protein
MRSSHDRSNRAAPAARLSLPAYSIAAALAATLAAACLAASIPGGAGAAEAGASPLQAGVYGGTCRRAVDIEPALFPHAEIAAYDFTGGEAARLTAAMDGGTGAPPPVSLVRLVLVPATGDAFAFRFGTDGCNDATLALDFRGMERVFAGAGVLAPFGPTYYQLPGLPS